MNELVKLLTSQLNINEQQATGGAGALLKIAQEKLGGDFSKITQAIPGLDQMMAQAPQVANSQASGLGGIINSVLSTFGLNNSGAAQLVQLAGQFKNLNLDMSLVSKMAPIIVQFAQQKGGPVVGELLQKVMKF